MRQWHQVDVIRPCAIPAQGPGVIVCNHISWLDPAVLQSTCPRPITYMMGKEMTEQFGLQWVKNHFPILPVSGSAKDSSSFKNAIRILANGELLGIFPEGGLARETTFLPFQPGAAMIAQRAKVPGAKVPVFPVCINGTSRSKAGFGVFLRPQQLKVNWGTQVNLDPKIPYEESTRLIEQIVHNLLPDMDQPIESIEPD
jgi:1-acyl-sn-glycerol-3-phosphate acyltransferase